MDVKISKSACLYNGGSVIEYDSEGNIRVIEKGDPPYKKDKEHKAHNTENMQESRKHETNIKNRCNQKWANDFRMIEYCTNIHRESLDNVSGRIKKYKNVQDLQPAFASCLDKWTDEFGINFQMFDYCTKQQTDSYNRMR